MSLVMRKPAFCICENKDREADQRLCFRYTDSTIPLLPKSEISSLWPSSVVVQPGLCRNRSETPKTGFLTTRPVWCFVEVHLHLLVVGYHLTFAVFSLVHVCVICTCIFNLSKL